MRISQNIYRLLSIAVLLTASMAAYAGPYKIADAQYKSKDYTGALGSYQQAIAQTSGKDQAKGYYKEGLCYHHLQENHQAVAAYKHAQEADPTLSFASSPDAFQHNVQVAQAAATASPPNTLGIYHNGTQSSAAPTSDPVANALAGGDVYIAPTLAGQISQTRLEQAAQPDADGDNSMVVKIAVLDRVPPMYKTVAQYTQRLHKYLHLGKSGLIVVAAHGPGSGIADASDSLTDAQEAAIAQKYVAKVGAGDYNGALAAMAGDVATQAVASYNRPMEIWIWIVVIAVVVVIWLMIAAARRKRVQINAQRGPIDAARNSVLSGIESMDNYIDVLPKNNADSDQVRAFRQAAAYKLDQADKIMARSTEFSDLNRAKSLLQQAASDVQNGRQYLDRVTGGTGAIPGDDAVRPIPFPTNQQQVNQVPDEQRGVSFFSSTPAPVSQLTPVTLNVDGQPRTVMATPQEADMLRRGETPPIRSFNVGGQSVPWYAYQDYDPYRDYYTYQNNGWRGIAGGAIAGFLGAELLNSLFSPRPYWGGGWNSPYAYGPGWDSWGGWGGMGYGGGGYDSGYDQGYVQGEERAHAQDNAFNDQYTAPGQDPNAALGGASFMGGGGGYDASDYGSSGGASFMGGDRS